MGKAFVAKKIASRPAKPTATGKVQKKSDKQRLKHAQWIEKITKQTEEEIEKSKTPLESLNFLRRSLEETTAEQEKDGEAHSTRSTVIPETLQHVSTRRGRKNTLLKEMEQFKLVMGHEQYRSNPLGILKEHLSNTVKLQQRSKQ